MGFSFGKADGIALPNCTGPLADTLFLDVPNTTEESRTNLTSLVFTAKSLSRPVTVTYRISNGMCIVGAVSYR